MVTPPQPSPQSPRHLVDDDVTTRITAEASLGNAGLDVVGFGASEAAVDAVSSRGPEAAVRGALGDVAANGQHAPNADLVSAARHAVDWTRLKRRINEIESRLESHESPSDTPPRRPST